MERDLMHFSTQYRNLCAHTLYCQAHRINTNKQDDTCLYPQYQVCTIGVAPGFENSTSIKPSPISGTKSCIDRPPAVKDCSNPEIAEPEIKMGCLFIMSA